MEGGRHHSIRVRTLPSHFQSQLTFAHVHSGPSEAIVLQLAHHLHRTLGTTYSLAESGVAGPTRPGVYRAEIKGPGYCPIAVVGDGGIESSKTVEVEQPKERAENMVAFAEEVLRAFLEVLQGKEGKL